MEFDEIFRSFRQLWEKEPGAIVLLGLGFVVFVFLVVDAWRHKRGRRKHR